jgi:hypothetical protein
VQQPGQMVLAPALLVTGLPEELTKEIEKSLGSGSVSRGVDMADSSQKRRIENTELSCMCGTDVVQYVQCEMITRLTQFLKQLSEDLPVFQAKRACTRMPGARAHRVCVDSKGR